MDFSILTPLLSEKDEDEQAEGALDPLGLYSIADELAVRLVPGVRERMARPRFLTAMAVGAAVCSEFESDMVAKDGVSEPWIVFEWHVVEGLVRMLGAKEIRDLPGRQKVGKSIRDGMPLSAPRYLKTAKVFGFHGVYRALAEDLGILLPDGRLGEFGDELVRAWAKEQGLPGFWGSGSGEGQSVLKTWARAVGDGLDKGFVTRGAGWQGWALFAEHLTPGRAGARERRLLQDALLQEGNGYRGRVLSFLTSRRGLSLAADIIDGNATECDFYSAMRGDARAMAGLGDLRRLLLSIDRYETFCRLLQDAFDDCLYYMSTGRGRIRPREMAGLRGVTRAARRVPSAFALARRALDAQGLAGRLDGDFRGVVEPVPPERFVTALFEHHRERQRRKPPNGKNPWFDLFDDGSAILRPGYVRDSGGMHDRSFVHQYRCRPLLSFVRDLRIRHG